MEEAKKQRTNAKRMLTITMKSVESGLENELDWSDMQSRIEKLDAQMNDVTNKYERYLELAYPDEGDISKEDVDWFDQVHSSYDKLKAKVQGKKTIVTKEEKNKTQVLGKISEDAETKRNLVAKCTYEENMLQFQFESLNTCLSDQNVTVTTLKMAKDECKQKLDLLSEMIKESSYYLRPEQVETELLKMKRNIDKMNLLNIQVDKIIESKGKGKDLASDYKQNMFKLERMKLPSFNGSLRDYPRFINDFKEYIIPRLKEDKSAAYVLRTCLSGKALEVVRNVDDNLEKMLERLHEKFGQKSKLTDLLMNEIKQLKILNDNDEKGFIKLVNTIESNFNDLSRIEMDREISNSTIVSLIEEKLPKFIKNQWCIELIKTKPKEENKFTILLEFLLMHKDAIEYGSCDLRSQNQKPGSSNNHVQGTANAVSSSKVVNNKSSGRESCWIHNGTPGAGHAIWQCFDFRSMTVPERLELVNKKNACKRCLLMKCPGAQSNIECKANFKCGIDSCDGLHNTLLHQENDTLTNVIGSGTVNHLNGYPLLSSEQMGSPLLPVQEI